jgi:hypothetical protein
MSHSGITPLTEEQQLISGQMIMPSSESNFFDFRQHTSSTWDGTVEDTTGLTYSVEEGKVRHIEIETQNGKAIFASGLNYPFPYPYNDTPYEKFSLQWWETSGIFKTYGPDQGIPVDSGRQSGIFHWDGFKQVSDFTNSPNVAPEVPEVKFYNYIHYLPAYPDHNRPVNKVEKREPIQIEFLSDVTKRNKPSSNDILRYNYDGDGLFPLNKVESPFAKGMCEYPDGTCRNNVSQQACTAYPGAIWTSGESCPEE